MMSVDVSQPSLEQGDQPHGECRGIVRRDRGVEGGGVGGQSPGQ